MTMLEWMDLELLAFIERYARQRPQWRVTAYFGSHPQNESSVQDVAQSTGVNEASIAALLRELCDLGLLETCPVHGQTMYRLTVDPRLRALAQRFARQSTTLLRLMETPLIAPSLL